MHKHNNQPKNNAIRTTVPAKVCCSDSVRILAHLTGDNAETILPSPGGARPFRFGCITPIYVPGQPKPICQVRGGVFFKRIRGSVHLLRTPPAICFDIATLEAARAAGAHLAIVSDTESRKNYCADLALIEQFGVAINRKHGPQVRLDLFFWGVNGQPSEHAKTEAITQATPKAGQLTLFEDDAE